MSENPYYYHQQQQQAVKGVLAEEVEVEVEVVEAVLLPPSAPPALVSVSAPVSAVSSFPPVPSSQTPAVFNAAEAKTFLAEAHWPLGLQEALIANLQRFACRYMILDDSSSMMEADGHRNVATGTSFTTISCSRWMEMGEMVLFHAAFAKACHCRTQFRFLNGGAPIVLGNNDGNDEEKFRAIKSMLNESPNGATPLCRHIQEVVAEISAIADTLRATRQLACVIIITDGEASDGDISAAMRPLKDLPVWVVVRLCTDSEAIVNYWNNIDKVLELQIDVIDDFKGEAEQVKEYNDWLTYGEVLHRAREFGVHFKELDLLDEASLSAEQVQTVCKLM